ncbi:MAG TPA: pyridoxamine 5'-phosphate oxidase family protein [Acidimicrobiia bacterium]|nr:pyridoxamine 5'-phosphate oxidase family protein [Acidimicrobiia bacterium]
MTAEGLVVLDESECYLLLHSRTLGRVGVQIAGELAVLPVFYAVMDRDIVFRTSPGAKLNAAVLGTRVVFEVDNGSPPWSVMVRGHAHEIREQDPTVHARSLLGHDWPAGVREHYVRITAEQVTGRRIPAE